jgi:spore coat polysaccharide biosynthesis protein SpsF
MRTVAIIQARMGSSRLRGKVLAEVCGKPLLQHMIERLERCKTLDAITVATPDTPENEAIHNMPGVVNPVDWFAGSEEDVLARVLGAARLVKADVIVELTADCPLIDPAIVDEAVGRFHAGQMPSHHEWKARGLDFASTSRPSLNPRNVKLAYPPGMDVRVFKTKTLGWVDELTQNPRDREHVSIYIWEHQHQFWCHDVLAPEGLRDDVRLTVDTPEDFALVRNIFEAFANRKNDWGLGEILELLAEHPEWRKLNAHVKQKEA